jgi:hypothetical protein
MNDSRSKIWTCEKKIYYKPFITVFSTLLLDALVEAKRKSSHIHKLENGTAQGTNFSSLAFITMIDDLTDSIENVESSLFVDDSMIFKGGRSLPTLIKSVQNALDAIAD